MVRVPTFIPESIANSLSKLFSGPVLDILWKLLVIALLLLVVYGLAASGTFLAAFVAGAILSALLADDITQLIRDIWHRNFWVWRT